MELEDWEDFVDAKSEQSAVRPSSQPVGEPCPAYEKMEITVPRRPNQPARLKIAGATWGGVNVTEDLGSMISAAETLTLDMHLIHRVLLPDPLWETVKTLTVLYQYEDQDSVQLLNTPEHVDPIILFPEADKNFQAPAASLKTLDRPWKASSSSPVEIIAVLYGPQRIETPSVLQELAKFFEGRRGQIRMTTGFFKVDTWPGKRKSWTVYFRFVHSKKIQCVTGMENGALELPWDRN
ncbi:hypothetical protein B0H66DRAFT_553047 [Apodospora peruviana]|uniref:Uncharacterized protein n=1 Tax=Apodospora peruviana TaxID=516989 RepID=A0AAE0ICZ0_9PEZI|nr:hypothetical protein B0H66DRAFT_553047 [Apodospora peruviana]